MKFLIIKVVIAFIVFLCCYFGVIIYDTATPDVISDIAISQMDRNSDGPSIAMRGYNYRSLILSASLFIFLVFLFLKEIFWAVGKLKTRIGDFEG